MKRDQTLPCNHEPVSLTSMESIIAKNIRERLDKHNCTNHSQHGFTKGKSYLTNLLSFYSKVYEAVDNGERYVRHPIPRY